MAPIKAKQTAVAVVGGGPVGLATALLLARLGVETTAIFPAVGPTDRRTAALFAGSIQLLRNLGLWSALEPRCAPMQGIRLIDGRGGLLRAPETLFKAADLDLDAFGFNVPNAVLVDALTTAAVGEPRLSIVAGAVLGFEPRSDGVALHLLDGRSVAASIVVGADGRQSPTRGAAGIATRAWDYPQSAIVTVFQHQRRHHGISTEFHRAKGPLTTVPMPGRASSLVWVESREEAIRLSALDDGAFAGELEESLSGLLGSVDEVGPRGMFPLSGLSAETLGSGRFALVGEAGHVMPPIGAQGLNLGLRDAAALAECVAEGRAEGAPSNEIVARYARQRAPDVASRIGAIDMLNRSLLTGFLPTHLLRGLGIYALGAIPPLRRAVVREGLQPALATPKAMQPGGLAAINNLSTPA